jgi:hypothetical protein
MLAMIDVETEKSDDTKRAWLENTVLPALAKLSVSNKDYVRGFIQKVKELLD